MPTLQVAEENCNYPCIGDVNQYCGGNGVGSGAGGAYISLFGFNATGGIPGDGATTSTGSPTSTPTGPQIKQTVGAWTRQGCYTEATTDRALSLKSYFDDAMTLESCAAFCQGFGFTMFGTEYSRECYCGDSTNDGSILAANQDDCNMVCGGDDSEYCGGPNRLDLYKIGAADSSSTSSTLTSPALTTPSPTGPIINPGDANYGYYACVAEPSTGRVLPMLIDDNDQMTVDRCLSVCTSLGNKYCGIEYGRECWGGDTLNLAGDTGATPGRNVTDSQCSFLCPGQSSEYCGADLRLTMYSLRNITGQ